MGKIERFEDLECWQEARVLVREIYKVTNKEKVSKDYDLVRQIRRAAISIMNNIAEGFARFSSKEKRRFLDIAKGSSYEVKSMLYVMQDLSYTSKKESEELHALVDKQRNLTIGLIRYLNTR